MPKKHSESEVNEEIRGAWHSFITGRIFRNNVGVAFAKDGRPIRYGLCNASAEQNKLLKSSDQIGIVSIKIEPHHVGQTFGVFTAIEEKKKGWQYSGTEREVAQKSFIDLILRFGGIATFATCFQDVLDAIQRKTVYKDT